MLLFLSGCGDSGEDEFAGVNDWIRTSMQETYLWNELVPSETDGRIPPGAYFGGLLAEEDNFSYITTSNPQEEFEFSSGVSPSFFGFTNSSNVFAVVEFVHPGSPADTAGLERGDIILQVDGENLTTSNFQSLFFKDAPLVRYSLGEFDAQQEIINQTDETIEVAQGRLDLNPLITSKIIESSDSTTKIGYLLLGQLNNGENSRYKDSIDVALQDFKTEGVSELIVDLRYCRGGSFDAAKNIADAIVPMASAQNEDVFVRFNYNDIIQQRIESNEGVDSDSLQITFSPDPENINLQRVYFLTTDQTRSTAEMLIKGLSPYMPVNVVGEITAGVQFGLEIISGTTANPPNQYTIVPVIRQAVNSVNNSGFSTPIFPDIPGNDDLVRNVFPIGSESDPIIQSAINSIEGAVSNQKPKSINPFKSLGNKRADIKGQIWFD